MSALCLCRFCQDFQSSPSLTNRQIDTIHLFCQTHNGTNPMPLPFARLHAAADTTNRSCESSRRDDAASSNCTSTLSGPDINNNKHVRVGSLDLRLGSSLLLMTDRSALLERILQHPNDSSQSTLALAHHLQRDGYVLIRRALPRAAMQAAFRVVQNAYAADQALHCSIDQQACDSVTFKTQSTQASAAGTIMTGHEAIAHHADIKSLFEHPNLLTLMRALLLPNQETQQVESHSVERLDSVWCRIMQRGQCTVEHSDYYRFASAQQCDSAPISAVSHSDDLTAINSASALNATRTTTTMPRLLTCRMPLNDYQLADSLLCINHRSHRLIEHESTFTVEEQQNELPNSFMNQLMRNACAPWYTVDSMSCGDLIVFDSRCVHASSRNESDNLRFSIDTRWTASR